MTNEAQEVFSDSTLQFENRLQEVVGRLSKQNYRESVHEIVRHFEDVYQEALCRGCGQKDATNEAYRRIGKIGTIAREIVHSSQRTKIGLRLQWAGVATWIFMQMIYELCALSPLALSDFILRFVFIVGPYKLSIIVGVLWAAGVFQSRKIDPRPVIAGAVWI